MNNSAKSGSLLARDVVINECAIECQAAKGKVDEVECRRELLSFTEGHLKHEHKFTKRQTLIFVMNVKGKDGRCPTHGAAPERPWIPLSVNVLRPFLVQFNFVVLGRVFSQVSFR